MQKNFDAAYYQNLHTNEPLLAANNWLLEHRETILKASPQSLLEVGCGNGKFLRSVAGEIPRVIGMDWARSPLISELPPSIEYRQASVITAELPDVDLICSADVLEHLPPEHLPSILAKFTRHSRKQFHVIACYDNNHDHISLFPPQEWLRLFRAASPDFRIIDEFHRRNDPRQVVCVISNF